MYKSTRELDGTIQDLDTFRIRYILPLNLQRYSPNHDMHSHNITIYINAPPPSTISSTWFLNVATDIACMIQAATGDIAERRNCPLFVKFRILHHHFWLLSTVLFARWLEYCYNSSSMQFMGFGERSKGRSNHHHSFDHKLNHGISVDVMILIYEKTHYLLPHLSSSSYVLGFHRL